MRQELPGRLRENGFASQTCDRPLAGRHIALTWSAEQGRFLSSQLEAAGARVTPFFAGTVVPVRDTTALDAALRNVNRYDWIVLTSLADVDTFAQRLATLGLGPDACRQVYIAMLIPVTARARELATQSLQMVPAEVLADDIEAGLRGIAGKRLLLLNAEHRCDRSNTHDTLATALRGRGADVDEVAAYRTIARPVDAPSLRSVLAPPTGRCDRLYERRARGRTADGAGCHRLRAGAGTA